MGNSYIKMKLNDFFGGFAYEYPTGSGKYKKILLSMHPDNKFKDILPMTEREYDNYYGDWYSYDGNSETLNSILTSFNPQTQGCQYLLERWELSAKRPVKF